MSQFFSFLSCSLSQASMTEKYTHLAYQITAHRWTTSETMARKRWKFLSIKLITRRKTISRKNHPQKKLSSHISQKYPAATVILGTSSTMKRLGNFLSQFQNRFIPFSCIVHPLVRLDLLNM